MVQYGLRRKRSSNGSKAWCNEATMDDEADILSNVCVDLVSLCRLEPGLKFLFAQTVPGSWTSVRDLYDRAGQPQPNVESKLAVTWLPSPGGPDYAVVLFFDDETKWSLTADYNVARLLGTKPRSQDVAAAG
jgi:hypothetical protein